MADDDEQQPYEAERPLGPTSRTQILERAESLIKGDRAAEYGEARDTHARIALIWEAILTGNRLTPETVALCMIGVKMVRAAKNPDSYDSWVDIAGYAALGGEFSGAHA